ncbi:hypothetical protein HYX19_02910 [Candidatus Woesearchaeota archaeon]|nr:hypothetical protein [Candidatus Woesearchaeota archaeon]
MYKIFTNFNDFNREVKDSGLKINLKELTLLDYNFLQTYDVFTIINIRDYDKEPNNLIVLSPKKALVYVGKDVINGNLRQFSNILNKKHGESTAITFLILEAVLTNYTSEFESIRKELTELEQNLNIDRIENEGRRLRKLIDRIEDFVDILIKLEERKLAEFDSKLINYDYNILTTEAKYWLERCRSNMYRIASLRTKCDIKSNSELNARITKLTIIMTFLTIVSIVVTIPGTVGAIFGIPALSDAYFKGHNRFLLESLVISTLLSVVLGYVYWKKLNLKV